MEQDDLALIGKYKNEDPELKKRWEEHTHFEKKIEELNEKAYLSVEETLERKRLQKLKLAGRDRIEQLLAKYRGR